MYLSLVVPPCLYLRLYLQADSLYNLRRPYDLVALLRQEQRAVMLENLRTELLNRKEEIDRDEDKNTGLEQRMYETDADCLAAGTPLPELDLYISTVLPLHNKGIRYEDHVDEAQPEVRDSEAHAPFCAEYLELTYSPHAFEHLEGVKERRNLTALPEIGLSNAVPESKDVRRYGHLVHTALTKNNTSWVLYNMAAFYWRIKGDATQTVECLRRALHFSPRLMKDVALVSLGSVLHRSGFSGEAAVVVHASLDVSRELNVNHFLLGNIYAVLAEYNKSVICFENTLRVQPDFNDARLRKHAVRCHAKLEAALEAQHQSLQRTLAELRDYQRKHEYWQAQHDRLSQEQAPPDERRLQRAALDSHRERESQVNMGEYCVVVEQNGRSELECSWGRKTPIINDLDFGWTDPDPEEEVDGDATRSGPDYRQPVRSPIYPIRRTEEDAGPHRDADWPSRDECDAHAQKYAYNEYPTTYLPAENKGFEVRALLMEAQGLREKGTQHPLPWYPPTCVPLAAIPDGREWVDRLPSVKERDKAPDKLPDRSMKHVLLELVDNPEMAEEEVGQRILTALKKRIGPSWVLYNLAALYWRVVGNHRQGIECVRRALHDAPDKYKDVPLVNLANVLYRWGRVDDAVTVMREAVNINDLEPETHYFLGNLLAAKSNGTGAAWHYREALHQNPEHDQAFRLLRYLRCYERFHRAQEVTPVPREVGVKAPGAGGGAACGAAACGVGPTVSKPGATLTCKNVNGEESCVLETAPAPAGSEACPGCVKQSCTVTAAKIDSCGGAAATDNTLKGAAAAAAVDGNNEPSEPSVPTNTVQYRGFKVKFMRPAVRKRWRPLKLRVDAALQERLHEVSEYLREKGACSGDDCQRLLLQGAMAAERPHTRLWVSDGVLHQKLLYTDALVVNDADCVIFNDGQRTSGCARDEFKAFFDAADQEDLPTLAEDLLFADLEALQLNYVKESCDGDSSSGFPGNQDGDQSNSNHDNNPKCTISLGNLPSVNLLSPTTESEDGGGDVSDDVTVEDGHVLIEIDGTRRKVAVAREYSDEDIIKLKPNPLRHIHVVREVAWPTWDDCKATYRPLNFKQFHSSWVSVSTKGVNLRDHVNFSEDVTDADAELPRCGAAGADALRDAGVLDALPGVADAATLPYRAETALRDALMALGGDQHAEPPHVVGTRVARAMRKEPHSWVLANLAALFWRVEGDAQAAVECVKLAYSYSPPQAKDVALLSLTNILHASGNLEAAILANQMALAAAPRIVAAHFSMATLYAAAEQFGHAAWFYESTLGVQANFAPARERLHAIRCDKVLSNPHIYKPRPEK